MRFFCIAALLVLASATATLGATYKLKADGSGDFPTIQAAIDAAQDSDVIILKNGRYCGEGNRDISFQGKAITVKANSGNSRNCIIDTEGSPDDPHRAFVFVSGEGPASVLEGITLTGGYAPIGATVPAGGAIALIQSGPTIRRCRIVDNYSAAVAGGISGFYAYPVISDCYFSGNEAVQSSAAIGLGVYSNASLTDCTFEGNISSGVVGALGTGFLDNDGSQVTVERCSFKDNQAAQGGGAVGSGRGAVMILDGCTFSDNTAGAFGGALGAILGGQAVARNCTFYGNAAPLGSSIFLEDETCNVEVENSILAFGADPAVGGAPPAFSCTDIYGNEGGDWTGAIADQLGLNGNISLDPEFRDIKDEFYLDEDSPCAPFSPPNEECDLIGAWPVKDDDDDDDGDDDRRGAYAEQLGLISTRPAGSGTEILYSLPAAGQVEISIVDIQAVWFQRIRQ